MESISNRINELITNLGISKNQFSKEIGTSSALISQITSGKDTFRVDMVQKIIITYPSLNAKWLLNGEGEMWIGEKPNPHTKGHTKTKKESNSKINELQKSEFEVRIKVIQKLYKKLISHLGTKASELEEIDDVIDSFSDLSKRISSILEKHISLGAGVLLIQNEIENGERFEDVVKNYLDYRSDYDKAFGLIKEANELLLKYIKTMESKGFDFSKSDHQDFNSWLSKKKANDKYNQYKDMTFE